MRVAMLIALVACQPIYETKVIGLCDHDAAIDSTSDAAALAVDAARQLLQIEIWGQSNAEGRAKCSDVTVAPGMCNAVPSILYSDEISDSPLNPFSWQLSRSQVALAPRVGNDFGVEMSAANTLAAAGYRVAFDKSAVGSTTIAVHWGVQACDSTLPPPAKCYPSNGPDLPTRAFEAADSMSAATGVTPRIVWWIQGEADAGYNLYSHAYYANEKALFQRFHATYPGAIVVFNQLSTIAGGDYNSTLRAGQAQVAADPDLSSYVVMIDSEGLPMNSAHFTADGYVGLGLRFSAATMAALGGP